MRETWGEYKNTAVVRRETVEDDRRRSSEIVSWMTWRGGLGEECELRFFFTSVEPRYNDPRYNDIPGITIDMLCPGKSYSKMYGTEPRYNDLRYNDIPDITMSF